MSCLALFDILSAIWTYIFFLPVCRKSWLGRVLFMRARRRETTYACTPPKHLPGAGRSSALGVRACRCRGLPQAAKRSQISCSTLFCSAPFCSVLQQGHPYCCLQPHNLSQTPTPVVCLVTNTLLLNTELLLRVAKLWDTYIMVGYVTVLFACLNVAYAGKDALHKHM